jgi:hypothetical protein
VKLPNADRAVVDERKLREYLLSTQHAVGRFKAAFFSELGFKIGNWKELRSRLMELAHSDATMGESTEYGQKHLIPGTLTGPSGRRADVVSVWIVLTGDDIPRLVTVYPM